MSCTVATVRREPWDWDAARRICLKEARRVLGLSPDVEDVAQEATVRAWSSRAACWTPERPEPWLAVIARREALRAADRRSTLPLEEAPPPSVASHEGEATSRVAVRKAVADLPSTDRALLYARYWQDLTQEDAADRLGIPPGTAKVRLFRARASLHETLSGV